jgi:hypothetical protein
MKSPDQMREEEEKREAEYFELTTKSQLNSQRQTPKSQEKKPEFQQPQPKQPPPQAPPSQKPSNPPPQQPSTTAQKGSSGNSNQNTPRQNPSPANKMEDFSNFFGPTNQPKPSTQPPIPTAINNQPSKQPLSAQNPQKPDFTNFFGASSPTTAPQTTAPQTTAPQTSAPKTPPSIPVPVE